MVRATRIPHLGHFDLPRAVHEHLDRPSWSCTSQQALMMVLIRRPDPPRLLFTTFARPTAPAYSHLISARPQTNFRENTTKPTVFTWSAWVRRTLSARGLMSSMEDMAGEV